MSCTAEDCLDPSHILPKAVFQHVLSFLPPRANVPQVSKRWNTVHKQMLARGAFPLGPRFLECPTGDLVPQWFAPFKKFHCGFTVKVDFGQFPREKLLTLQYRQYVRGQFLINGMAVPHKLIKNFMLSKEEFHLDGPKGGDPYGLRSTTNKDLQRASTYCHSFEGRPRYAADGPLLIVFDDPGIVGEPGDTITLELEFVGQIMAFGDPTIVIARKEWTVKGTYQVPNKK
jgi:hypothetical protein